MHKWTYIYGFIVFFFVYNFKALRSKFTKIVFVIIRQIFLYRCFELFLGRVYHFVYQIFCDFFNDALIKTDVSILLWYYYDIYNKAIYFITLMNVSSSRIFVLFSSIFVIFPFKFSCKEYNLSIFLSIIEFWLIIFLTIIDNQTD
jgi:hypothetical protein